MNAEPRSTECTTCSSRSQLAVASSVATFTNTDRPSSNPTIQRLAAV